MSSMRSNVSVRESTGSIVLNVSGVVLIGSPNLGTKVSGPSFISFIPSVTSIQNTRFSMLSQYRPSVLCFFAKSSIGLTWVFFTYSFFLLSRLTSHIITAWPRMSSGSLVLIVEAGTSSTAKSLLKLLRPLLPNFLIIGSIQKFSFGYPLLRRNLIASTL